MSKKEIEKILELANKNVKNNVKILSNTDLDTDFVIRIDTEVPKNNIFFPKIAHSQASSEDRTLPRIVASKYLLGCLLAIPNLNPEYSYNPNTGYVISAIEFDYCLKPNKELVFDAEETDEVWLITYNKDTIEYKSRYVGEIILDQYIVLPTDKKRSIPKISVNILVKVIEPKGIYFNKKIKLEKGFYSITFNINKTKRNYYETTLDDDDSIINVTKLENENMFNKIKKQRTSLEMLDSFKENKLKYW